MIRQQRFVQGAHPHVALLPRQGTQIAHVGRGLGIEIVRGIHRRRGGVVLRTGVEPASGTARKVSSPGPPGLPRLATVNISFFGSRRGLPLDRPMRLNQCPRSGHYGQSEVGLQESSCDLGSGRTTVTFPL